MESLTFRSMSLKFRPHDGRVYFTVSDLNSLPDWPESPLLELINGDLFLMPSPDTAHQKITGEIFFQIKTFLNNNPIGTIFSAPYDVVLSDEDTIIPDIVFVSKTNEKIMTSKNIQGPPDLIIEVVSTNRKHDFISKRDLYEKFGVKEYLIVDFRDKLFFKYVLTNEGIYKSPEEVPFTFPLHFSSIPGLILNFKNKL